MTTTPVSPDMGGAAEAQPEAPPSMDIYEQIGRDLSEPGTLQPEADTEQTTAEESPAEHQSDAEAEHLEAETSRSEEAPAEEPKIAAEQPEEPQSEEDGLDALLKSSRGKRIYQGYKFTRELSQPPQVEQGNIVGGGIGHLPSIQEIRDYYQAYADQLAMENDFSSGDEAAVQGFLEHWFKPERANSDVVLGSIPKVLSQWYQKEQNPERKRLLERAYIRAATPFLDNYRNSMWRRYQEAETPELKQAYYFAAQALEKDITGRYRNNPQSGQSAQPEQQDPTFAEERARFERERREFEQQRQAELAQQRMRWEAESETLRNQELDAKLDTALEVLKSHKEKAPRRYAAEKREFKELIMQDIERNQQAWAIQMALRNTAARTMDPRDREAAQKHFMRLAESAIINRRAQFLKEIGASLPEASAARHASLQQTASKKAPTSSGAPRPQSIKSEFSRRPGETHSEAMVRRIQEDLAMA
jgi:hypothetical protein